MPDRTARGAAGEVVAEVLKVTPPDCAGEAYTGDDEYDVPIFDDPKPVAARQAAAVLRWLADNSRRLMLSGDDAIRLTKLADDVHGGTDDQ